jgi:hypothetical protein
VVAWWGGGLVCQLVAGWQVCRVAAGALVCLGACGAAAWWYHGAEAWWDLVGLWGEGLAGWWVGRGSPVLSVYFDVEKPSMS